MSLTVGTSDFSSASAASSGHLTALLSYATLALALLAFYF
jgi:hypothetical protein